MNNFVRSMGSLVRGESSYSNEPDPWDNDVPLSFQSVRRESRAKPPPSLRIPRTITLPTVLSLLSPTRPRTTNDGDDGQLSGGASPVAPMSVGSTRATRQRVIDEDRVIEHVSPGMAQKSFIHRGHASAPGTSPSQTSRSVQTSKKLEGVPPMSPVSNAEESEEARQISRRNWLRGVVRRVLRLRGRE